MKNIGVYVGRFCPLHKGHIRVIDTMINDNGIDNCIVFIGSCSTTTSWNVLFNYEQRHDLIKTLYPELRVVGIPDVYINNNWEISNRIWLNILDDILDSVFFYGSQNRMFYGGCREDLITFITANRYVNIVNRDDQPIRATDIREKLLIGANIMGYVHKDIIGKIKRYFDTQKELL